MRLFLIFALVICGFTAGPALSGPMTGIEQVCELASSVANCEAAKRDFMRADIPAAFKGKVLFQRQVAACIESGCDGAVAPDMAAACAWHMVIVTSDALLESSDASNYRRACMKAGRSGWADARIMAEQAFRMIYKKKMPDPPPAF